ncbi:hypothetical protein RhiirC2_785327 [Rhizophagus irregularis]|uniref:Uncharacterized protein n=1 Tax=Rhizophagus irregularis TaxID=588596 RepID=A0A2N1MWN5_9GLOM|nr:hypothetical protein RhiirC2_785327 [Rhizophagus irregularis]
MSQFTEFYSKVCVAGSVKFVASKEEISLSESDHFSRNLATILARDSEVVAVNLKILPDKCRIYILKNNAPMKFVQATEREDVPDLILNVFEYCSEKLRRRLDKLKKDIRNNKDESYTKSLLEFLEASEINVGNLDGIDEYEMAMACCEYYKKNKNNENYPQRFLGHIKKVGSYSTSVMDIVNCARKEKYKTSFSNIDLHLLDPIHVDQPISSWNDIIKEFIPNQKNLEDFKKKCLKNYETRRRINKIYGGTGRQLDHETTNHMYLHAELNILTNTDILSKKHNEFIAVSKNSCYLCESFIKFLRSKGYKITISGVCKKLYPGWKLPDTYSEEFVENVFCDLDEIIESGIEQHTKIIAKSDSDGESADSDNPEQIYIVMKKVSKVASAKANSNLWFRYSVTLLD